MLKSMNLWILVIAFVIAGMAVYILITADPIADPMKVNAAEVKDMKIDKLLSQYEVVEVVPDFSGLTENQKKVVKLLVEAGKIADEVFWKQAGHNTLETRANLMNSDNPGDKKLLEYVKINYGPYDRLDGNKDFITGGEKPLGAGFYPEDLTKKEFEKYIKKHPEQEKELTSLYTVVRRTDDDKLEAIPFSKAYPEETKKMHDLLMKASELSDNASLKAYLKAKAEDLMKDDFYNSDTLWLKLKDNDIDVVIGPTEVYEDTLYNNKAGHEVFVMIKDKKASAKLKIFNDHKTAMEGRLPVPAEYKKQYKGLSSPLAVVQMIFSGGSSNAGTKTIAFNLPNDEKVREETGSKKVLLKNVLDAKFNKILVPIAKTLLVDDLQKYISVEAFSTNVLMHEFSHAFGLNYTVKDPKLTVKKALGGDYSAIEECKADILGLYNESYFSEKNLIDDDELKTHYATAVASIFRSIRFGANGAHGTGNLIQFNFLVEQGGIIYNEKEQKYDINFEKLEKGVEKLANIVLTIQGDGDAKRAKELIEKYGKFTPQLTSSLERLGDLPVDIVFDFKI